MTLRNFRLAGGVALGAAILAAVGLASCDNGPSAVETRDRADQAVAEPVRAVADAVEAPAQPPGETARWTSNSRNTAEENIRRLYERNGAVFGASSPDAYVELAHAFIADPPAGTETVRRANGDTLFYQAATNTFLVATADGVPRTMFKPDDGADYWDRQKAREAARSG